MKLKIQDVSVKFISGHSIQAVDHVNIDVADRDKIAIVGETGSGKSILLLAIIGLLGKDAQVTGRAIFEGVDLMNLSRKQLDKIRGARISYIPQGSGNGMNPLYKVGFQVGEPLMEHCGMKKQKAILKAIELLKMFHIGREEKLALQYPHTYSGGMRQRALIAMGIGAGAEMLLADEPTKGLDEKKVELVAESFRMLKDKTILCVTHDLNFARSISNYICVMYAASQVEYGSTREIIENPLHPYTRDMLNAMPENGLHYKEGFAMAHEDYKKLGCKYAPRCSECFKKCSESPPMVDISGHKVRCWKYVKNNIEEKDKERENAHTDKKSDKEIQK